MSWTRVVIQEVVRSDRILVRFMVGLTRFVSRQTWSEIKRGFGDDCNHFGLSNLKHGF